MAETAYFCLVALQRCNTHPKRCTVLSIKTANVAQFCIASRFVAQLSCSIFTRAAGVQRFNERTDVLAYCVYNIQSWFELLKLLYIYKVNFNAGGHIFHCVLIYCIADSIVALEQFKLGVRCETSKCWLSL